jgi:hypothetical protein
MLLGSLNIEADLYSKVFDFDDWEVSEWVFKLVDKKWLVELTNYRRWTNHNTNA